MNQAICIDSLDNHLLCPMQCCLNSVHISDVLKFLADNPSETTHAIELIEPFDASQPLIISLKLSSVSYFDVYHLNENEDIPKIRLTAEEPPSDPSTTNIHKERLEC